MNKVMHYYKGSSDKVYMGSIVEQPGGQFEVICKWGRRGGNMSSQNKGTYSSHRTAETALDKLLSAKAKKGYQDIERSHYAGPLRMTNSWLRQFLEESNIDVAAPAPPATADEISTTISAAKRESAKELMRNGKKIAAVNVVREATGSMLQPAKEFIEEYIEPEVKAEKSMAPAPGERDFEVVCVNNLGMEDSFDEGVTYVAEPHPEDGMIFVWDRAAVKQELFKERFKVAELQPA